MVRTPAVHHGGIAVLWAVALALAWSLAPCPVAAQRASLVGTVADRNGAPVAGAVLDLRRAPGTSADTGAVRGRSGAEGAYALPLPPGGGEYVLTATHEGFLPRTLLVSHAPGAGTLTQDIRLTPRATEAVALPGLVVSSPRRAPTAAAPRRVPGEISAMEFAFSAQLFPVEPGDLIGSVSTEPGVLPSGGAESGRGVSVGGQPASQNRTTLDGAGFGAGSVPAEALAASGVVTHPYDVSRGQFTGGEIAGTTRSGTNQWGGSASLSLLDPRLQYAGAGPYSTGGLTGLRQLSAGGGGPAIPGRLFVYGAAQLDNRRTATTPVAALLDQSGIAPDSLERFMGILRGFDAAAPERRPEDLRTRFASGIARFDYLPGERHAIMARLDAREIVTTGVGSSPLSFTPGAELRDASGGILVQATSTFESFQHQLRVYGSSGVREVDPGPRGPAGIVRVGAARPGESFSSTILRFGGSPLSESRGERSLFDAGDQLLIRMGGDAHLLRLGASYTAERSTTTGTANRYGTFTFSSLDDLEAGRATSFTRTLRGSGQDIATSNAALYAGDTWTLSDRLSVVFGARAERRWYPASHAGNARVDSLFGVATGRIAPEWGISPRAGFRYQFSPLVTVQGGAGEFRGGPPTQALATLLGQTGVDGAGEQLVCLESAAPAPEWSRYLSDASAVPALCANGEALLTSRLPSIGAFSAGYAAPRVRRASLNFQAGTRRLALWGDLSLAWGSRGALARDLNLVRGAAFQLPAEGGRPVYAPEDAIDPLSGGMSVASTRLSPDFGIVREVAALGRSRTRQLVLEGTWQMSRGYASLSYTNTRSMDEVSGIDAPGTGVASTGGDPSEAEWAPRDFEQRHAVGLRVSRYATRHLQFTLLGRILSGVPFSPMVERDINGDGISNDRAFVFTPDASSTDEVARAMAELVGRAPASVRSCLLRQAARVAARNSCRTPWTGSLDAQLNLSPFGRPDRRLTFSVSAQNILGGLDYVVHGANGVRGWGQSEYDFPDPVLLRVRGFDAAARRFRYEVNRSFGTSGGAGEARVPFTIRIQGRVAVGADPATQPLNRTVAAMDAAARGAGLRRHFESHVLNVPALVLALSDSLRLDLSAGQAAALRRAADSLAAPVASITDSLVNALAQPRSAARRAGNADELSARGRIAVKEGVDSVREILTPAQWERLPARLRRVPRRIPRPGISLAAPF